METCYEIASMKTDKKLYLFPSLAKIECMISSPSFLLLFTFMMVETALITFEGSNDLEMEIKCQCGLQFNAPGGIVYSWVLLPIDGEVF
jgi:hypothetical protein